MNFDPFAWASRYSDPATLHRLIRYAGAALFAVFLIRRIGQYRDFSLKPLWAIETLVYATLLCAFLMRADPIDRSKGWREVAVPVAGGLLPFALLLCQPLPALRNHPVTLQVLFWFMTLATALTVWGMWTLRRSFSITVEARELVLNGPYRWIRHPIYSGEILTAAAVTAWRFHWRNAAIFVLFVIVQLVRARWEEQKLAKCFPEYSRRKAWWFW